jgi:hypothetical protein
LINLPTEVAEHQLAHARHALGLDGMHEHAQVARRAEAARVQVDVERLQRAQRGDEAALLDHVGLRELVVVEAEVPQAWQLRVPQRVEQRSLARGGRHDVVQRQAGQASHVGESAHVGIRRHQVHVFELERCDAGVGAPRDGVEHAHDVRVDVIEHSKVRRCAR